MIIGDKISPEQVNMSAGGWWGEFCISRDTPQFGSGERNAKAMDAVLGKK